MDLNFETYLIFSDKVYISVIHLSKDLYYW